MTSDQRVGDEVLVRVTRAVQQLPGLRLLVLHGSRATGQYSEHSDWDFGYLAAEDFDPAALHTTLTTTLGTDDVDVVELARASSLLRFRTARDGYALVERPSGAFLEFRLTAIRFWCDAGPVIRAAQEEVLAAL